MVRMLMQLWIMNGIHFQVKRMVAAAGNRVEGLHRESVGGFELPADLEPGQWRYLTQEEILLLS